MTTSLTDYKTEQQLIARGRRLRAEAMRDFLRAIASLFAAKPATKLHLSQPAA